MPDEICPLLFTSKSREHASCIKNDCKWFHSLANTPASRGRGTCCVHNIGFELRQIDSNISNLINFLRNR